MTPPQSMLPPGTVRSKDSANSYGLIRLMAQYPTKDGRYVQTTPPPRGALSLAKALFPAEWIEKGAPPEAAETVRQLMLTKTMQEWEDFAQGEHGAGLAVCKTSAEWLHDRAAAMLWQAMMAAKAEARGRASKRMLRLRVAISMRE